MKKVAIVGASGYSGEELVRLLLNHPHAELVAVTSRQNAGQTLAQVFPKFASHPKSKTLRFTEPNAELLAKQAEIVFLALPHGVAAEYAVPLLQRRLHRHRSERGFPAQERGRSTRSSTRTTIPRRSCWRRRFTACPRSTAKQIKDATLIASPGCYPDEHPAAGHPAAARPG